MSWLFSSASASTAQFDELVDKATSELLPTGSDETLLTSLQLSDLIRSKAVDPSYALKSLRRRISHKNPNVQIQSLHVLDILVKNSGEAFLLGIANGKDGWMAQLEELCKNPNHELRQTATREIQNWALAFQSGNTSPSLSSSDLVHLYNRLRYVLDFPPADQSITSSMITSLSAPEWEDSDLCQRCRTPFTVTNRKHHCRNCGGVFCGECSGKKMKLEHLGIDQEVRVCDGCHKKLSMPGGRSSFIAKAQSAPKAHRANPPSSSSSRKTQEEIDFERAIALSLAEGGGSNGTTSHHPGSSNNIPGVGPGYDLRPSQPPPIQSQLPEMPSKDIENEDPDLAAAIRASLADMPPAPQASTSNVPYTASAPSTSYGYQPQAVQPTVPSFELAMAEFDALDSFANAMPRGRLNGEDANELFYKADRHRGKMIRSLEDAAIKSQMLDEMNRKLQRAVKVYDQLLERRVGMYSQPQGYQPYTYQQQHAYPQQAQQPYQPSQQPYQPSQQPYQPSQQPYQPHQQPYHQYNQPGPSAAYVPPQHQQQTYHAYSTAHHDSVPISSPDLHRVPSHPYGEQQQQLGLQRTSSLEQYTQQHRRTSQEQQTNQQRAFVTNPGQTHELPESTHYDPNSQRRQHSMYDQQQGAYQSQQYQAPPGSASGQPQQYAPDERTINGGNTNGTAAYDHAGENDPAYYYESGQHPPAAPPLHQASGYVEPESAEQQLDYANPVQGYEYGSSPYASMQQTEEQRQQEEDQQHYTSQPASSAPASKHAAAEPQQQLYDSDGQKLRLQGYYSAASFPEVPDLPVGGLPSVPNGPLAHYEQAIRKERSPPKQEAALIEF